MTQLIERTSLEQANKLILFVYMIDTSSYLETLRVDPSD